MILLLDNYDSFAHNLARYLVELGEDVEVVRNDVADAPSLLDRNPSHLVVSPGPCTPADAGVSVDLIRTAPAALPVLGVCLGHQCIADAYGASVVRGPPVHGKTSEVAHDGTDLFSGLPSPLAATRYHSLVVNPSTLGDRLLATAWTRGGILMALRHSARPVWGVQFHPEAVLTEHGHALLRNFLSLGRGRAPPGLAPGLPDYESPDMPARGGPWSVEGSR